MKLSQAELERFQEKIKKGKKRECWEWQGTLYQNGYGMVCLRRGHRKTFLAHRVSWMVHNGKAVPNRMMICHTCDNRWCVNPHHLYAGTGKDNNTDTIRRKRGNRKMGSRCSWSKLTERDVLEMRRSKERNKVLAERFKLDPSTISQIRAGLRWKHLLSKRV